MSNTSLPPPPSGVTFSTSTPSCSGTTTLTCNLVNGATTTGTIQIRVNSTTTGTISNTASVAAAETDPTASNYSATVGTTVDNPNVIPSLSTWGLMVLFAMFAAAFI